MVLFTALAGAVTANDNKYLNYQRILSLSDDSAKCAQLLAFADALSDSLYDFEFALLVYEKTGTLLANKNYPTLQRDLYYKWAYTYYMKGNYEEADKLFTKVLALKLLDATPALKARILNMAGVNLQDLMMYKRALHCYNEALKIYSMLNDIKGKGMIYQNMANIFALSGDLKQSDQFFDKAIKIFLQNNLVENYGASLGNKAYIRWKLNDLASAKALAIRSLNLDLKKVKKINLYIDRHFNLALIYCEMERWDSCFYYLNRGKAISDSMHLSDRIDGAYYYNMGYCYTEKGELQKGIFYFKKALKLRSGIANYRSLYDNVADLYFQLKQYDTAFMYKNASLRLSDSIYKSELKEHVNFENKRIELLEKDYNNQIEATRQQQFLDGLKKRNYLLVSLVILLVAGVVLLFLYFRQYRLKVKKEHLQSELDFLKAQMNPHFLFNSINNIYVLLHEDKDKASRILLKFSELLRYQLYDCNVSTILLDKELKFLENYIEFETLRYSNKIQVQYELSNIAPAGLHIAPLLLQPFVENAFKHTPRHKHGQSLIHIRAALQGDVFTLEVSNTRRAGEASSLPGGIGLENVKKRLALLYSNKHRLEVATTDNLYTVKLNLTLTHD